MNPFLEWLVAISFGIFIAVVFTFIIACVTSYLNIWVAGFIIFMLLFGMVGLFSFITYHRGGK